MLCDEDAIFDGVGISEQEKARIRLEVRSEFPDDDMLYELHLIRVARYLRERKAKEETN